MARLFVHAVSCPTCSYPNDHTFRFCQNCGYVRKIVNPQPPKHTPCFNLENIDLRLHQLKLRSMSSAYSKQKLSLQQELENFLYALPGHQNLFTATPRDICRFLVFKDCNGKTKVHHNGCPAAVGHTATTCQCPTRLAYKTIDSYIGKLRSIFNTYGRQGEWNNSLLLGNPATDYIVKHYLKAVTSEQLQAHVIPKQATPIFSDKVLLLARYFDKKIAEPTLSPTDTFLLTRDQAYFKTLFFSGDRGADLGQIKTREIARFPDDQGLLFNHIWGKTLRDGGSNVFGIRRHPNPTLCPIKGLESYVATCRELSIDLSLGYLFRPTNPKGNILDKPFTGSAAEARLKLHLQAAHLFAGETLHSFRSGCALTLMFSGSTLADVLSHVGWKSPATASYYLKLADVLRAGAPADVLCPNNEQIQRAAREYSEYNSLLNFVTAFPSQNILKRSCPD